MYKKPDKLIQEKKKLRQCLGPGCNRKIMTTKKVRLCIKCRRIVKEMSDSGIIDVDTTEIKID